MVYHVSGLGLQPGGLTVPLSYVYLALKAAVEGDLNARNFFRFSGRIGGEGGRPEAIVAFTSKEVITGNVKARYEDRWYGTRKQSVPEVIAAYLSSLLSDLNISDWPKFYFVEVDYTDFEDCFLKAYPVFMSLANHEVWVNMVGGSNQINASLLSSGCFTAVPTRYYYVFQEGVLLHPHGGKPKGVVKPDLSRWYELPFFSLQIGEITSRLSDALRWNPINIAQLESILQELGLTKQFIPKLISSRIVSIKDKTVFRGEMLDYWDRLMEMIRKDFEEGVGDVGSLSFGKWKEWAGSKGILWIMDLERGRPEKYQS